MKPLPATSKSIAITVTASGFQTFKLVHGTKIGQRTRRKIELGWFEAVVLLLGYVGSLAVVGAAGIYIGQRAVPERLLREERVFRLPVPPDGGGSGQDFGKADPEMTFRRLLGRKEKPSSEGKIVVREKAPEPAPVRTTAKTKTQATTKKAAPPSRQTAAKMNTVRDSPPQSRSTTGVRPKTPPRIRM